MPITVPGQKVDAQRSLSINDPKCRFDGLTDHKLLMACTPASNFQLVLDMGDAKTWVVPVDYLERFLVGTDGIGALEFWWDSGAHELHVSTSQVMEYVCPDYIVPFHAKVSSVTLWFTGGAKAHVEGVSKVMMTFDSPPSLKPAD